MMEGFVNKKYNDKNDNETDASMYTTNKVK